MRIFKILILLTLLPTLLFAAKQPERKDMRTGNEQYKEGGYSEAELSYRRAMEKAPALANPKFNLGNALYKQVDSTMQPEEAKQYLEQVHKLYENAGEAYTDAKQKAATHYNDGNTYLREQNWSAAVDAYKKSLRLNPNDMEAKQNLVFAQAMNNQQQQNQQQQQQNQDKNKDEKDKDDKNKDDKNKDQNKDKQDQQQPQNQDKNKDKKDQQQQQPQEQKISKEDAQRMLQALEQQEKETQEKVKKEKAKAQQRSSDKNW